MRPILQNLTALFVLLLSQNVLALNCSNIDEVAKEAVEFSMLGAGAEGMSKACFENQTFKYFSPADGGGESEEPTSGTIVWFDPTRDSYTFIPKREGEFIQIQAVFTVKGRKLRTTYTYQPLDYLQEEAGICGLVYNDHHEILRSDCRAKR